MVQLDARPTDDQKVAGSNPARSAAFFMEIDREIFPHYLLSANSRREGVSFWRKNAPVVIYRFED